MKSPGVGAVVIGRNEGERLRECLASVAPQVAKTVYVDSGSTDGSVELATVLGADPVLLNSSTPFTAARARNAGWRRLLELEHGVEYVQFVDGDCELNESWIENAVKEITVRNDVAIVAGHVREKFPDRNVFHRLASVEWDTPLGTVPYCGGIALVRLAALSEANGFNDTLIAGEEPELCVRLRQRGWKILKIDREMASHDIDLRSFRQWWRRMFRAGHAYAEGAALHGKSTARHWVHESRSNWFWGAVLPIFAMALAWPTYGLSVLAACALYLALFMKILLSRTGQRREAVSTRMMYALMCVVAKSPEAIGQAAYWTKRVRSRPRRASRPSATSVRNI